MSLQKTRGDNDGNRRGGVRTVTASCEGHGGAVTNRARRYKNAGSMAILRRKLDGSERPGSSTQPHNQIGAKLVELGPNGEWFGPLQAHMHSPTMAMYPFE